MKRLAITLLLLSSFFMILPTSQSQNPVALSIKGPTALTPGQNGVYFVNVTGGPAEYNGTYTVKYWIESSDTTGAYPLFDNPGETSSKNNSFEVNITVPTVEGDIYVAFEVISENNTANSTVTGGISVSVLAPLILTASFSNNGQVAAVNITIRFYIDDNFIGSKVISKISPGDRGTATLNWIPVGLEAGQHTIRVEADINKDGIIDGSNGEIAVYEIFYKTGGELAVGYLVIIGIVIIFGGLILIVVYRRWKKTR